MHFIMPSQHKSPSTLSSNCCNLSLSMLSILHITFKFQHIYIYIYIYIVFDLNFFIFSFMIFKSSRMKRTISEFDKKKCSLIHDKLRTFFFPNSPITQKVDSYVEYKRLTYFI